MTSNYNDSMVNELEAFFIGRNDLVNRWGNVISSFQALPGLVGFWPMSSIQRSTGNAYDLSSQSRTLTYNGNPTYNYYNDFIPYIDLDGTGDFLSRADETDLDILGTETIYNANVRGLTLGGWFWRDNDNIHGLITKGNAGAASSSYELFSGNFRISNGAAYFTAPVGTTITDTWFFQVGRFIPSAEVKLWVNATSTVNVTSIPASINNSIHSLIIGAFAGPALLLNGRASLCFLCANALSDAQVNALYQQSRVLFGV